MSPRREEREVDGRTFPVSSLDKVYFPAGEAGHEITKGDVLDYYQRIAEIMLPHVRGRIISMHRWPDGIDGYGFYQKDVPEYFPGWIETVEVQKEGGTLQQVVIEGPATLVYLAQQACITPHVWLACAEPRRHPDRMVFDFDPDVDRWEDAFPDVRWAARKLKEELEAMGLAPYLMTSGSKGLHVWVPLDRSADFDTVRAFARGVAEKMAKAHSDRLTVEQRKNKREGRIFIDVLRNGYAQTAVAPYALRARPGAPVATPLDWDELGSSGMGPRKYTLRNVFRRLARKDDPWKDMEDDARALPG